MEITEVVSVDPEAPDDQVIARAAALIRAGKLVAFPTETVYGLGANAFDSAAVARVFEVKGRSTGNPVIVHVHDSEFAQQVVSEWPDAARRLTAQFWPGPLTLVLPKSDSIPPVVTAGGSTVAVRCPNHPVALALLRAARVPIAAPSANRSTEISPTRAEHVMKSLNGRIPLILDGGPCIGGVESTVLDLCVEPPQILRPGLITAGDLSTFIGTVEDEGSATDGDFVRSPGTAGVHYAPRARLHFVYPPDDKRLFDQARSDGIRVGWMTFSSNEATCDSEQSAVRVMPDDPETYARLLYATLHHFDDWGAETIVASAPPDNEAWRAVRDRLYRASRPGSGLG